MRKGHQSWVFASKPVILATGTVVGPFEGEGPLADDFDIVHGDLMMEQDSWEKAENMLMEEAVSLAIEHAGLTREQIHFFILEAAKNSLLTSEKNINEIAYELGFEYPQYIVKLFKQKTGKTPSAYRSVNCS
jgi:hypothetical protein